MRHTLLISVGIFIIVSQYLVLKSPLRTQPGGKKSQRGQVTSFMEDHEGEEGMDTYCVFLRLILT